MKCFTLVFGLLISVGVAWGQDPCSTTLSGSLGSAGGSVIYSGMWTQNPSGILPGGCSLELLPCDGAVFNGCSGFFPGSFQFTYDDTGTTATFTGGLNFGGDSTCAQYAYLFANTAGTDYTVTVGGVLGLGCAISGPVPQGIGPPSSTNPQATTKEPISTGTGNYYYQHTDLSISGSSVPLAFERTYNSQDNYSGALGVNWTHSYNITLGLAPTGRVVKWGDGHGENYTLFAHNYHPDPGVTSTLTEDLDAGLSFVPLGSHGLVSDWLQQRLHAKMSLFTK